VRISPGTIARRFESSLSPSRHRVLHLVGNLAEEAGSRAYLVGGIVRDVALDYPDTDFDVVIEGDAERVARAFAARVRGELKGLTAFGTCKVETAPFGTLDFATARSETYDRPGALPRTQASDMTHDLARRDFTINAMALALNPGHYGELLDPCGGLSDLKAGRLRVMHDRSLLDDPTRILRGVRFAARYGFTFERRTLSLLRACLAGGGLGSISGKRVFRELGLVSMEPRVLEGLKLLGEHGIVDVVFGWQAGRRRPQDLWRRLPGAIEAVQDLAGGEFTRIWVVWFASLFADVGRKRAGRLALYFNLPKDVRAVCLWTAVDRKRVAGRLARLDLSKAYRVKLLLDAVPPEALVLLFGISPQRERGLIRRYLKTWRHVRPALTGADIASLGMSEGPAVGTMLDRIVRLKLAGKLETREAEIALVRRTRRSPNRC
jgi:tRNA nucleotidyltransferase (CCA-adding enzyme)